MAIKSKSVITVNGKKIKSDYQKRKEKYKFNLRDEVIYVGIVQEQYSNQKGTIVTRMSPKGKVWYHVVFEDGKQFQLLETVLEKVEDKIEIENVEEGSVEGEN